MASDNDVAYASAVSLLELYRRKVLSPVEATRLILDRLEALEPRINAFCIVDRDGALAAARASEERWLRGAAVGRLDGVPVTIKDLILMHGFPTLRGSRLVERDQDWSEDAPAVARLREAGAVIIGKTTTPEFGWKALGDSPLTGITRNPWDLSRTPGGSSAGAVAACAAGLGPLHVGSDGAGSIRIPSAFTGVFGLKPSFGRVGAGRLQQPFRAGLRPHLVQRLDPRTPRRGAGRRPAGTARRPRHRAAARPRGPREPQVLQPLRASRRARPRRQARPLRGLLPPGRRAVLVHAQAHARHPRRGPVRRARLPRPRRPRLDLPRH